MTFEYFPKTDMLYIKLVEEVSTESEQVTRGILLDFDEEIVSSVLRLRVPVSLLPCSA